RWFCRHNSALSIGRACALFGFKVSGKYVMEQAFEEKELYMQEYNFDMNSVNRKRQTMNRVLAWGVIGSLVVVAILLLNTELRESLGVSFSFGVLFFAAAVLGAIIGASILACREALHYALRQMVFVLNDNEII